MEYASLYTKTKRVVLAVQLQSDRVTRLVAFVVEDHST